MSEFVIIASLSLPSGEMRRVERLMGECAGVWCMRGHIGGCVRQISYSNFDLEGEDVRLPYIC